MKTGQLESFLHNVVTLYYDSFESHTFNSHSLCNKLIAWLCDHVSVVLKYKINARQKTYLCFSALLTIPVFFDRAPDISAWNIPSFPSRWQFNLAVKKVRVIFPLATDHGLTDAISELFSTASASATILSLNARLYDVRRALGMWQLDLK